MRILSGAFKGRTLLPPAGDGTRPITALVKKSLFGILSPRLDGATVLDLYCGTGTIGLEALSQGAARCCFAERDGLALARLRRNIETLGVGGQCTIWAGDVEQRLARWLDALDGGVDVASVDPPFATARRWDWPRAVETVFAPLAAHLSPGGVVVLRTPDRVEVPDRLGPLAACRTREYGGMKITFLELPAGG